MLWKELFSSSAEFFYEDSFCWKEQGHSIHVLYNNLLESCLLPRSLPSSTGNNVHPRVKCTLHTTLPSRVARLWQSPGSRGQGRVHRRWLAPNCTGISSTHSKMGEKVNKKGNATRWTEGAEAIWALAASLLPSIHLTVLSAISPNLLKSFRLNDTFGFTKSNKQLEC